MFSKLASLVSIIALATAAPQHPQPATQFPAGVDPALCPNFPICDNAFLHNPQSAGQAHLQSGQWNPAPAAPVQQNQWNNPAPAYNQWNPAPANNQWNPAPANNQWNPAPVAPQWTAPATAAPQWAAPQQNWAAPTPAPYYQPAQPAAYNPPASNHLDSTGGDKYPAGVNPQSCPNYPYCDTSAHGVGAAPAAPQVAPLPGYTERQYPAGVSAQQCPNFPYCS